MAVDVKICGLRDHRAVDAALEGGARYVGFVFYPPSPRAVTAEQAIELGRAIPADVVKVGVMVDPDDALIARTAPALDALQLHGQETPERVRAIKLASGRTVIKGMRIGEAKDLMPLAAFTEVADMILFDAKPPRTPGSLPGGNGLSFDWRLLERLSLHCPWMLSGGLNTANLEDAVRLCRAGTVDVSSGVETEPGIKDLAKIRDFLGLAAGLEPPAAIT
jgi:phosphoribosylanthranilate isomerase